MATIVENYTPDYVSNNGQFYTRSVYGFDLPVALAAGEVIIIDDFEDREATAISVTAATIVKIDVDDNATAISAADDLNGFRIGYQSAAGDAAGDPAKITLHGEQILVLLPGVRQVASLDLAGSLEVGRFDLPVYPSAVQVVDDDLVIAAGF